MASLRRSPTRNCPFLYWSIMKIVFTIAWLPTGSHAYGDIFVMNASLINSICTNSCDDKRFTQMLQSDCYRGCRFFDLLNKDSIFMPFDDVSALESCNRSCSEAYANETTAEDACKEGCAVAQREYHSVLTLSLQWLRELQRNRTFFETLIEITNSIVFPSSTKIDAGQFIQEVPNRRGNLNRRVHLKIKPVLRPGDSFNNNKTFIAEVTRESYSLPEWVPLSALALSTVGTILTIGVCCYCCLFAKIIKEGPNKSIESDPPPSYEQLLRTGLLPSSVTFARAKVDKPQDETGEGLADVTHQLDHQVIPNSDSIQVHEARLHLTIQV